MEGLYRMVRQLQDQNRKLSAQMVAMNRENNRRENEVSYYQNNDDPIGDEEKNNTHSTRQKEKTFKTTTTQGPSIYLGPFSEFNMSVTFPENFKLVTTLKPYNGTRDLQVHVTMFKSMILVNGVSDPFLCRTFPTFLERQLYCGFYHYQQV